MNTDNDETALARLGYKQEFKRAFTPLEVFGIGFSIVGLLPSMASVLVFALPNGGPVGLVWGWAVCSFFLLFIGMSIAELGSAAPTSGGLYYWTHKYAAPKWKDILSWICGYSNTIGNIASIASLDWGCAVQLMAAVSIGSNLTFVPTTAQIFGVYVALLICHGLIASLTTRLIARLQRLFILANVVLCLAIVIALPVATPKEFRNSATYAFSGFTNLYGWPNGFAFLLSFLAPLWAVGGFDSSVHISEEASNAQVAVPWAIMGCVAISGIIGWAINVVLAFCMGTDVESIMASPIGQPMATILFNSLGRRGTLVIWALVVAVQFMMGISMLTACSRQVFAFSRDGALPFSTYLYRINAYTQTPVNCVWFSAFISFLLGFLAFAGPNAVSAIFSLVITGQYLSYTLPIASRFLGGETWIPGPFTLGKLGLPVAIVAVLWMMFSIIIVIFPTTPGPTAPSMNYTLVVWGGSLVLCIACYYWPRYGGASWFKGPVANIPQQLSGSSEEFKSNEKEKTMDIPRGNEVY